MASPSRRKVVALIRVSSSEQAKDAKSGLDRQRSDIRFTAHKFNLEVMNTFELVNIIGPAVRRTEKFRELKKWVARPDIDGLVIPAIDRLSRSTEFTNVGELFQPFEEILGGKSIKRLWTGKDELDVTIGSDRDKIWGKLRHAEEEREIICYRTSQGRDILRHDADTKIDVPPQGILWERPNPKVNSNIWSYDPLAKARMRDAYHRLIAGEPLRTIHLDAGYSTPMGLRSSLRSKWWVGIKAKTKTHLGRVWDETRQKMMRRDRRLLSTEDQIETVIPELRSDPCVTDDVWIAAQAVLDRNVTTWSQKRSRTNEFLGIGLLHCRCGRKLYHKIHQQTKTPYYYCSYGRLKTGTPCKASIVRAKIVDEEIGLQAVLQFTNDALLTRTFHESMNSGQVDQRKRILEIAEKMVVDTRRQLRNAEDLAVKLGVTPEREERIRQCERELAEANAKVAEGKEQLAFVLSENDVETMVLQLKYVFSHFMDMDIEQKKMALAKYVQRIDLRMDERLDGSASPLLKFHAKIDIEPFLYQDGDFPEEFPIAAKGNKKSSLGPIKMMEESAILNGPPSLADVVESLKRRPKSKRTSCCSFEFGTCVTH